MNIDNIEVTPFGYNGNDKHGDTLSHPLPIAQPHHLLLKPKIQLRNIEVLP